VKNNNALHRIQIFMYKGQWVFDDESKGINKEPFVFGIPAIINAKAMKILGTVPKRMSVTFASTLLPIVNVELERTVREHGGAWYIEKSLGYEGWLCPALLKYFKKPPKHIYIYLDEV